MSTFVTWFIPLIVGLLLMRQSVKLYLKEVGTLDSTDLWFVVIIIVLLLIPVVNIFVAVILTLFFLFLLWAFYNEKKGRDTDITQFVKGILFIREKK